MLSKIKEFKKKIFNKERERYVMPTIKFMLKLAVKEKPLVFIPYITDILINVTSTFAVILIPKMIIDEIMSDRNIDKMILYVAVLVGMNLIFGFINNFTDYKRSVLLQWFDNRFQLMLSEQSMKMDFEHTEDPAALDQLNKASEGISWYGGGINGVLNPLKEIIRNTIVLAGVVVIVASGSPLLLLIQLTSLIIISVLNDRLQKVDVKHYKALSKINRIFSYVFFQLTDFKFGKDIRLYDSKKMMLDMSNKQNEMMKLNWRSNAYESLGFNMGMSAVNVLRDVLSYPYLGWLALKGTITIGEFSMIFSAISNFYWSLFGIVSNMQEIFKKCNYAYEFLKFLDYPSAMEKGTESVGKGSHTIEFSHVSFKYPRTDKYILRDLSLTIKSGEHLSIVGLNGAGKTTFIKLLCRLYDVTDGEILIDGINIKRYSDEEYRKIFAVVFQDFKLFAFTLKENIALQDSDNAVDDDVYSILTKTGLEDDAVKLENGINTIIYKSFDENGTELSGGQKQKTAISRALYKNAPVVILDEPTAALDPVAEYDIYRQFNDLVGGKTAIYISHRLSSCKFCDRIAVFSDDTVKEYGTHDELVMIDGGIYAEMFRAQAQYYK